MIITETAPVSATSDASLTGLGLVTQTYDTHNNGPTNTALVSQTIYALSVPVVAGMTVSNVWFHVGQAAIGTVPTSLAVGISSPTTSLITPVELKSDTIWTGGTGFRSAALGTTYTFTYTGFAYVLILENGAFGSTVLQLARASAFLSVFGAKFFYATAGASVTTIPAANAAVTLASSSTPLNYWAGLS